MDHRDEDIVVVGDDGADTDAQTDPLQKEASSYRNPGRSYESAAILRAQQVNAARPRRVDDAINAFHESFGLAKQPGASRVGGGRSNKVSSANINKGTTTHSSPVAHRPPPSASKTHSTSFQNSFTLSSPLVRRGNDSSHPAKRLRTTAYTESTTTSSRAGRAQATDIEVSDQDDSHGDHVMSVDDDQAGEEDLVAESESSSDDDARTITPRKAQSTRQMSTLRKPTAAIPSIASGFGLLQSATKTPGTDSRRPHADQSDPQTAARQKTSSSKPLHRLSSILGGPSTSPNKRETGDLKPFIPELFRSNPNSSESPFASVNTVEQDIAELLSPRKKRRGWVKAGLAERAANVIKRNQTSQSLWLHETQRLLSGPSASRLNRVKKEEVKDVMLEERSDSSSSPSKPSLTSRHGHSRSLSTAKRTLAQLKTDLNPGLRLQIVEIHSSLPPSLARLDINNDFGPAGQGGIRTDRPSGGGFITGGVGEKLMCTTCRILHDADEEEDAEEMGKGFVNPVSSGHEESYTEGIVLFSLTTHPRSSLSTASAFRGGEAAVKQEGTVVPSLPHATSSSRSAQPSSSVYRQEGIAAIEGRNMTSREGDHEVIVGGNHSASLLRAQQAEQAAADGIKYGVQAKIPFETMAAMKRKEDEQQGFKTLFVPASIVDLHSQMKEGREVWCWEPWHIAEMEDGSAFVRIVDLSVTASQVQSGDTNADEKQTKRGLMISKFALLC